MKQYMKFIIKSLFSICISAWAVSGCNKKPQNINVTGEIFITTKGGDVVRFGGVPVRFFNESILLESIDEAMQSAPEDMPFDAAILKTDQYYKTFTSVPTPWSQENTSLVNFYAKRYHVLKEARDTWPDAHYVLTYFPDAEHQTRTDSGGNYSIVLPPGKWIAVVEAERLIGEDKEYYYWTVKVSSDGKTSLSNHNLATSNSPDSILNVAIGYTDLSFAEVNP
jgi:hypothetical protein